MNKRNYSSLAYGAQKAAELTLLEYSKPNVVHLLTGDYKKYQEELDNYNKLKEEYSDEQN